jgi:hypothetical protein
VPVGVPPGVWAAIAGPGDKTAVQVGVRPVVLVAAHPHNGLVDREDMGGWQIIAEGDLDRRAPLDGDHPTQMRCPIRFG